MRFKVYRDWKALAALKVHARAIANEWRFGTLDHRQMAIDHPEEYAAVEENLAAADRAESIAYYAMVPQLPYGFLTESPGLS